METNVAPVQSYAGFWLRFWAFLFDISLLSIILMIVEHVVRLAFGLSFIAYLLSLAESGISNQMAGGLAIGALLIALFLSVLVSFVLTQIIGWLYYAMLESSSHQATLGKMLLGLRVTASAGTRPSFVQASIRHVMKSAAVLPAIFFVILLPLFASTEAASSLGVIVVLSVVLIPLFFLIFFGMAGITPHKQAMHDMIAGCYVVKSHQIYGGKLIGIIIGIVLFAFIAKGLTASGLVGEKIENNTDTTNTPVSQTVDDGTTITNDPSSYPQLHLVGVGKGVPADGEEDPVWWKKCEMEGIEVGSTECHQKYASVEEEGVVSVKVTRKGGSLILAFMASEPTTWKVDIAEGVTVEKIILAGSAIQKIEGKPAGIPLSVYTDKPSPCDDCYQDDDYFYGHDEDGNLQQALRKLKDITGKTPTTFQGLSKGDSFFISDSIPDWRPKNPLMLR